MKLPDRYYIRVTEIEQMLRKVHIKMSELYKRAAADSQDDLRSNAAYFKIAFESVAEAGMLLNLGKNPPPSESMDISELRDRLNERNTGN